MSCFYALFRPQNGWLFKAAASRTVFVFIFQPGVETPGYSNLIPLGFLLFVIPYWIFVIHS